jgi:hypothetical protein
MINNSKFLFKILLIIVLIHLIIKPILTIIKNYIIHNIKISSKIKKSPAP